MAGLDHTHTHDEFYGSAAGPPIDSRFHFTTLLNPTFWSFVFLTLVTLLLLTRLTSDKPSRLLPDGEGKTIWRLPYWIPFYGNTFAIFKDSQALVEARDRSGGIFSMKVAGDDYVIVSHPVLIERVLSQESSFEEAKLLRWKIASQVFGLSNREKYDTIEGKLNTQIDVHMKSPQRYLLRQSVEQILHSNIPQMISFATAEIDLQPWERSSKVAAISTTEVEADLMTLLRDMLSHAIIPALFGRGLLEKYPSIIRDIIEMDDGIPIFLSGLPFLTPWPGVMSAHLARRRLWQAMDEQQRQLDNRATGKETDYSWGDLDDVSPLISERNRLWRENGFAIKERGDLSVLWAAVVTAPYLAAWNILHILSTPTLLSTIRSEISPHVEVSPPVQIGKFSSPPNLSISNEGLLRSCPLFKSSMRETLRLSSRDRALRTVDTDDCALQKEADTRKYVLPKGANVVIPHELHLHDPEHFSSPEHFIPDRFVVHEPSSLPESPPSIASTPLLTESASSLLEFELIEQTCMSFVAGILMMWDIEPVVNERGRKEWKLPKMGSGSGVARPEGDVRVRVKARKVVTE